MEDVLAMRARLALTRRARELVGREAKLAPHLRGEDGRREADSGDVGVFLAGDEVLEGLEEAALAELREIRAALGRLADGTYGTCTSCGGAIAPGRLEALPHAARCARCAT